MFFYELYNPHIYENTPENTTKTEAFCSYQVWHMTFFFFFFACDQQCYKPGLTTYFAFDLSKEMTYSFRTNIPVVGRDPLQMYSYNCEQKFKTPILGGGRASKSTGAWERHSQKKKLRIAEKKKEEE